jgi:hypothetical protein
MLTYSEKFFIDDTNYIQLTITGANSWLVEVNHIEKKKLPFISYNKKERISFGRYSKDLKVRDIIDQHTEYAKELVRDWKKFE